jgi:hypothetical protein
MKRTLFTLTMTGLIVFPLAAQESANSIFTAAIGAGFTTPVYGTGSQMDTGWNTQVQAGVNFLGGRAGLVGEFDFNTLGINSSTVQSVGYAGGNAYIYDVTADPVIRFHPNGKVSFYVIGGPGVYHRRVDFSEPSSATFVGANPFFGVFPGPGSVNQVVASSGVTKLGVNGGAGINFRMGHGKMKIFAEARYHQMYTYHTTSWIPVTFGFRW